MTVDNEGPDQATNVTITDVLDPSELEFVSEVSADQGSYDETTDIWTVGTVADGASLDLVLRVRLVALGGVVPTPLRTRPATSTTPTRPPATASEPKTIRTRCRSLSCRPASATTCGST